MSSHDLKVQSREKTGKENAKVLRRQGLIPTITYGHKEEPVMSTINARELRDILTHGGSHGLLNLKSEGGASTPVIIKSIQRHPVSHNVIAVDFLRVSLDEKVRATVPIHLEGEPPSVKMQDGVLVQALHEIEVEALPQDLPEFITVDVTSLEFNGAPIHIKEVTLPRGVVAITDGDESIAVVNPPTVEDTGEALGSDADPSEVEAIEQDEDPEKLNAQDAS